MSGNYLLNWWVELKVEGHGRVCVVYFLSLKHYICKETQLSIDPRVWTQLFNVADNSAMLQLKRKKILLFYSITAWYCIFFQIFYVLIMNMKKLICAKGKSKLFSTAIRILERLGIQTSSLFVKFDRSVLVKLKPIFYFFGLYMAWFFNLKTIGVS